MRRDSDCATAENGRSQKSSSRHRRSPAYSIRLRTRPIIGLDSVGGFDCVLTVSVSFNGIALSSFLAIKLDTTTLISLNAPQVSAGMVSEPADTCGADKLFVAVATISTDAFRFSAIR